MKTKMKTKTTIKAPTIWLQATDFRSADLWTTLCEHLGLGKILEQGVKVDSIRLAYFGEHQEKY